MLNRELQETGGPASNKRNTVCEVHSYPLGRFLNYVCVNFASSPHLLLCTTLGLVHSVNAPFMGGIQPAAHFPTIILRKFIHSYVHRNAFRESIKNS